MKKLPLATTAVLAAVTLIPAAKAAPGDQWRLQQFHDYMANHGANGDTSTRVFSRALR
jgi:Spy/CpxP family protein refolding chaperone